MVSLLFNWAPSIHSFNHSSTYSCIHSVIHPFVHWFFFSNGTYYFIIFFKNIYLFIYLAAPGLSCGMWGSLVAACKLLVVACGTLFPDQGLNPGPLRWECGVLATGPPGKSRSLILILISIYSSMLCSLVLICTYLFFHLPLSSLILTSIHSFLPSLINQFINPLTHLLTPHPPTYPCIYLSNIPKSSR